MKKIRFISLVLACLMLVSVTVACSNADDGNETTTTAYIADTTEATVTSDETKADETTAVLDGLEMRDMHGEELNIWYTTGYVWNPYPLANAPGGMTGDIINDAGYERNAYIEDKLGVKLVYTANPGNPNDGTDYKMLDNLQMSGDISQFDIVMTGATPSASLAVKGFYYDMADSNYIDATADYYENRVNEQVQYHGHQYFASGFYSVQNTAAIDVTYINIDMVEAASEYKIDDLYDLALENKWTISKLLEIGKNCFTPNSNTGNYENDKYSLILSNNYCQNIYFDLGGTDVFYEKDIDTYKITVGDQKNVDLLGWMQANLNKDSGVEYVKNDKHCDAFIKGAAPFMIVTYNNRQKLMDSVTYDWGFLPVPLMNEGDEYRAYSDAWNLNFAGIPAGAKDTDKSEYLYDAFMRASYGFVYPAYYEQCFGIRYQRDDVGSKIFDILASSRSISFANIYGISFTLTSVYTSGSPVASSVKGAEKSIEIMLKKLG